MRKGNFLLIVVSLTFLVGFFLVSYLSGQWVYSAAIIGFLFGFAMQKGKFCGADIMSSVVLYKDLKGPKAVLATIAVSMVGFAIMNYLGMVKLSPKAVDLLPMIIGGFVFGIGTVLGGGCISGSLYKAGEGRFNSMLALIGIGLGTLTVKAGVFKDLSQSIKATTAGIQAPKGLNDLLGIDYIYLAVVIFILMLIVVFVTRRKLSVKNDDSILSRVCCRKWSIVSAGAVIGVIAWLAYLSSAASGRNYPLGVTGGVMANAAFLAGVGIKLNWWLFIEVLAIILGSLVSARLSGELKMRSADPATLIVALIGGVLMGVGAVLAHGCFIGNIISGWALLSLGSLLAGLFIVLGNWLATYFYLRGTGR